MPVKPTTDNPGDIHILKARSMTPGAFFLMLCEGKFTDEHLSGGGNAFAQAYFDFDTGTYLDDYESILLNGLAGIYHVQDTWDCFDRLKPLLDLRSKEWRESQG